MKPFRFRLGRLFTLRANEVTAARFALAQALAQEETAERALLAATALRRQRVRELAEVESAGTTAAAATHSRRYLEALRRAEYAARDTLEAARSTVDQCRAELTLRQQDARALDKLKAARQEAHQAEGEAAAQRTLDDLAAGRVALAATARRRGGSERVEP